MFGRKPKAAEDAGLAVLQALVSELQAVNAKLDSMDAKLSVVHAAYQSINPPR